MKLSSMSYRYVIDAYAWIEYFRASDEGEVAKKYIKSRESATPTIVIAELSRKLKREIKLGNETEEGRVKRLEFVRAVSQIVNLDFDTALKAGAVDSDMKKKVRGWGFADSIVLCTARATKGKVITGDEHFRGLREAILIKKR